MIDSINEDALRQSRVSAVGEGVAHLVCGIASRHADDVDAEARFPVEAVDALRRVGALSAGVPVELGGAGCGLAELGDLCERLARCCGSSAMVLAMHYSQLACLVRHRRDNPCIEAFLRELVDEQRLLASMTSEVGTYGETRASLCALEARDDGTVRLRKEATTGSYNAQADAILVTCRHTPDSPSNDQRLVLVRRDQATLTQTGGWDTLGMRGTCSPPYRLDAVMPAEQVLPDPFDEIASRTMVPYSHVLWSALWSGIAADAVARASRLVREQARAQPSRLPAGATMLADGPPRMLDTLQAGRTVAAHYDRAAADPSAEFGMDWALRFNHLKVDVSTGAHEVVHGALQVLGVSGYRNDSPSSVGRHYRDILSASLMISNTRILAQSAAILTVLKG